MTADNRRKAVREWISKIERTLATSRADLEGGWLEGALNRAYYAAFYAAKALLATRGLDAKKHKGVAALMNEHFGASELLPREAMRDLRKLLAARMDSDYEAAPALSAEAVSAYLSQAEAFVAEAERLLREEGWLSE